MWQLFTDAIAPSEEDQQRQLWCKRLSEKQLSLLIVGEASKEIKEKLQALKCFGIMPMGNAPAPYNLTSRLLSEGYSQNIQEDLPGSDSPQMRDLQGLRMVEGGIEG